MHAASVDLVHFACRADRVRYMTEAFAPFISGRVLEVGCDQRLLKQLHPGLDYVGIDIRGDPDLKIDLEAVDRLPFPDQSFDAVLCSEVLEHLDNLHHAFGELVRVARRYILISLPNCWTAARRRVRRGTGHIGHYGLPPIPPRDRHKWFFCLTEARAFALAVADQYGLRIAQERITEKQRLAPVRLLRRLRHPKRDRYLNLYANTLWVLFERPPTPAPDPHTPEAQSA